MLYHFLDGDPLALGDSRLRIAQGSPAGETDAVTRPQGKQSLDIEMTAQKPGTFKQAA